MNFIGSGFQKWEKMLSYRRDTELQGALVFKWKTGTGR